MPPLLCLICMSVFSVFNATASSVPLEKRIGLLQKKRGFYLGSMDAKRLEAAIQPDKRYLVRELKMPDFERLPAEEVIRMGRVRFDIPCAVPIRDRAYTNIGPKLKGYRMEELEEHLSDETQTFVWGRKEWKGPQPPHVFPCKTDMRSIDLPITRPALYGCMFSASRRVLSICCLMKF